MGNLTEALAVTVLGIFVVFTVLIVLMGVLYLMRFIAPKQKTSKETVPQAAVPDTKTDETELVAVLAAAIAASAETHSGYQLNIKSYRRVSDGASAWAKTPQK